MWRVVRSVRWVVGCVVRSFSAQRRVVEVVSWPAMRRPKSLGWGVSFVCYVWRYTQGRLNGAHHGTYLSSHNPPLKLRPPPQFLRTKLFPPQHIIHRIRHLTHIPLNPAHSFLSLRNLLRHNAVLHTQQATLRRQITHHDAHGFGKRRFTDWLQALGEFEDHVVCGWCGGAGESRFFVF